MNIGTIFKLSVHFRNEFLNNGMRQALRKSLAYLRRSTVIDATDLYCRWDYLANIDVKLKKNQFGNNAKTSDFSAIVTVLNEARGIDGFLKSIMRQSLTPTELVVVDGGSEDGTFEILTAWAKSAEFPAQLIRQQGASIAEGRNTAIKAAKFENIVLMDAGCELDENYFLNLVAAATSEPDADLVAGAYSPSLTAEAADIFIPDWNSFDSTRFLPSARSCLIKKSIALEIGGFPEFLPKTGEDTLFDIQYRRNSKKWLISTAATVNWHGPRNEIEAKSLAYSYGYGDGLSGIGDFRFSRNWFGWNELDGNLDSSTIFSSTIAGYLQGRKSRISNDLSTERYKGIVLILSLVPIADSGGGQRATQLAMQYSKEGYKVLFATVNPSFESTKSVFIHLDPSTVELFEASEQPEKLLQTLRGYVAGGLQAQVIVEAPHPTYLNLVTQIKEEFNELPVIFDYIDNWDSQLGGSWYQPQNLLNMCEKSDLLTASANLLGRDLESLTGREVLIVPNALNPNLLSEQTGAMPEDLPLGFDGIALYVGALWGTWFDWELLEKAAKANSNWAFVLIGEMPDTPPAKRAKAIRNIFFLGLKSQVDLPGYISESNVCIIPFTIDEVTAYVNPLKVYEYLAFGKPVISSFMPDLEGLPQVTLCHSHEEFISAFSNKFDVDPSTPEFIKAKHSWADRIDRIRNGLAV
jgi:glycosyltransferase involved in cell wall biosynthesis